MTLLETIKILEYIASQQPNINGIVESGDIYDLNKDEYQTKYSAFCITQNTHTIGTEFNIYSFTLFYVDRLTLDKSNKLEIQSTAVEFFSNMLKTINEDWSGLNVETGDITTFTERFTAECAGAYMTFNITTTPESLCKIITEQIEETKGEFNPNEFSNDFFLFARRILN